MQTLDAIRARFPALATPWILFDNAGGAVPVDRVIARLTDYMSRCQVQHGATYELSRSAMAAVAEGRRAAAELLGSTEQQVVLGSSSTALVGLLSRALAPGMRPGDEVVVTNLDHETNIGAWRRLEARGVVVREWQLRPETAALALEDLEPLLGERTRLVCFTHCANVVGTIHDVAAITRRVHEAGAHVCVDGVAYAPHRQVDVAALDVDYYFASLYKVYGPHLAVLHGRRDLLLESASQNHFFIGEDQVPYKLEPGGVTHELVAALPGILDYLLWLDEGGEADATSTRLQRVFAAIAAHEEQLATPLLEFLTAHPRVRVIGSSDPARATRVPTIAFTVHGLPSSQVTVQLDRHRIAARYGHFYAHRAMSALGLPEEEGIVRVSMVHYNTVAEVAALIAALDAILPH